MTVLCCAYEVLLPLMRQEYCIAHASCADSCWHTSTRHSAIPPAQSPRTVHHPLPPYATRTKPSSPPLFLFHAAAMLTTAKCLHVSIACQCCVRQLIPALNLLLQTLPTLVPISLVKVCRLHLLLNNITAWSLVQDKASLRNQLNSLQHRLRRDQQDKQCKEQSPQNLQSQVLGLKEQLDGLTRALKQAIQDLQVGPVAPDFHCVHTLFDQGGCVLSGRPAGLPCLLKLCCSNDIHAVPSSQLHWSSTR